MTHKIQDFKLSEILHFQWLRILCGIDHATNRINAWVKISPCLISTDEVLFIFIAIGQSIDILFFNSNKTISHWSFSQNSYSSNLLTILQMIEWWTWRNRAIIDIKTFLKYKLKRFRISLFSKIRKNQLIFLSFSFAFLKLFLEIKWRKQQWKSSATTKRDKTHVNFGAKGNSTIFKNRCVRCIFGEGLRQKIPL